MGIRTFARGLLYDIDRIGAGMEIAFPKPVTLTATGVAFTWAALGFPWEVAPVGLALVCAVRLRLDPKRWGEHSVTADEVRAYFAHRDAVRRAPARVEASRD